MKQTILLLIIISLFFGCTKDEVVSSGEMFDISGRYGEFKIDTIYAYQDTFIFGDYSKTENSLYLNVGRKEVFSSLVYIKFAYLPVDTVELDSVSIQFRAAHWFGSAGDNQLDVDVFATNKEWSENLNRYSDWHNISIPGNFISRVTFSTTDSATTNIEIPAEIVRSWQSDSTNFGLILVPAESEDGMLSLYSLENDKNYPLFIFNMVNDTSYVKDTIAVGNDATVFEFDNSLQPNYFTTQKDLGNNVISSGTISRALYKFDFTSLPETALIQSADFKAYYSSNQYLNNPDKEEIYKLRRVVDAESLLTHLTVDSSFISSTIRNITVELTADYLELSNSTEINFGRYMLQDVLNDNDQYPWFLIEYENPAEMLSLVSLEGINNRKPYLIVRYFDANRIGQ